jgi:hypothetical protein
MPIHLGRVTTDLAAALKKRSLSRPSARERGHHRLTCYRIQITQLTGSYAVLMARPADRAGCAVSS